MSLTAEPRIFSSRSLSLAEGLGFRTDFYLFQTRQVPQPQGQNRFGLDVGNAETGHQGGLGVFVGSDDGDDLVDVQKGDEQAVENVEAIADFCEAVLQPPPDSLLPKGQPLGEQCFQSHDAGPPIQTDHVEIDPVAALEVGGGKEVGHEDVFVDPVGSGHDDQARRVFMVRFVAQIGHHGKLFVLHLGRDLFDDPWPRRPGGGGR